MVQESSRMGARNTIGFSNIKAVVTLVRAVLGECLRWQLDWN